MIDFNIVWSVVLALMLIRIVDNAVDYAHYLVTKKKRDKAFAEFLAELEAEIPAAKPVRAKKATAKKKSTTKRK